jgi:hypothetical protein
MAAAGATFELNILPRSPASKQRSYERAEIREDIRAHQSGAPRPWTSEKEWESGKIKMGPGSSSKLNRWHYKNDESRSFRGFPT